MITEATSPEQIQLCIPLLQQLRPTLDATQFVPQIQRQMAQGYHLAYLTSNSQVVTAAGYRILEYLSWGKTLYLDDLITDSACRGQGHATSMLDYLMAQARANACDQFHLDSGHHRHSAHRLYLRHRLQITCHHFALELQSL